MDVENEPRGVADEEEQHDDEQHYRLLGLVGLPLVVCCPVWRRSRAVHQSPPPPDDPVDPVVEHGQHAEREHALHQQPGDVHIGQDVSVVQPELGGGGQGPVDRDRLVVHDLLELFDDEPDLEELGDVEQDGEDDDWDDVAGQPLEGARPLHPVVVLHRPPDGPIPLQGEGDGHVDGAAEDKVVELVEEVAEGVLVVLAEAVVPPEALQYTAYDVEVVKNGQEYQEPIKDGIHLLGAQYRNS